MAAPTNKRIIKELAECTATPPAGIAIAPSEEDTHIWHIQLSGPQGTPYAGGTWKLLLVLPTEYPFKAPKLTFATRIYHPNITNDNDGSICLSLLKSENWKPALRVSAVLEAVRNLLAEPVPDDPLEPRIADEYNNNRDEFNKNVKAYVAKYAK